MNEVTLSKYKEMEKEYKKCDTNCSACCGTPASCMYAYNVMLDYRECEKGVPKEYETLCRIRYK